jgi:hypothetical protein
LTPPPFTYYLDADGNENQPLNISIEIMAEIAINIPSEALPDLQTIAELDDQTFNSLVSAIGETQPTLTHGQFIKRLASKSAGFQTKDIAVVLKTAFVLYSLKGKRKISASDMAGGIVNSSLVSQSPTFPQSEKEKLRNRLAQLLTLDKSLGVTAKAFDVMTEHERIFCGARILSDIRPVFADNPESASAAMIIHNLQIGFHQDGKHQEFYVALDTDDIQKLKEVVERAEKKTIALKSLINKSEVPYLEV